MADRIGLDIRLPIGGLFGILGFLLAGYGLLHGADDRWVNVNLWWGAVMIVFSVALLLMATRRRA